ncbi:MAG: SlyX family protein [Devosia sp.]
MAENNDALVARLDALEIRIAYQDQTIEDLNTALAAQWQEVEKLRREMALLEAQLREAAEGGRENGGPEPPPPHY